MTQQKITSSPSSDTNRQSKRTDGLFSRFAAFYGHVWRSQFKNEGFLEFAKKEWHEGLSEFSDSVMDKAILQCREHYEMPPTLPQMIACCRQIKRRSEFYVVNTSHIPASQEVVVAHLNHCKNMLSKN